jgi:primosomal protein N' (replication factor Y)
VAKYALVVAAIPLKQAFTYGIPENMAYSVMVGVRVVVPFGRRELTGYVIGTTDEDPDASFVVKPIKRVIDHEPLYGPAEVDLAAWMARFYLCSQGEAIATMIPGGRRDSGMPALDVDDSPDAIVTTLTDEQRAAVEAILAREVPMYYLYGVTGSGKTEVFLQAAEAVIAQGRQVIYLVPEITLTHQLARQVSSRFEGKVAVLHSALTPSQRLAQWKKIKRGEVMMAIGARSAVFAPFGNLGLVIIDEEHENSYKSGSSPRYHARQVAQKRCQDCNATLVMGSATPSLEAWKLMEDDTRMRRLHLPYRVAGGVPPKVSVVNMLGESRTISRALQTDIQRVLDRHRQVILFLNRRGFSYFFHCRSCGYEMKCPHCSVALTYHKERGGEMVCHYCGYRGRPINVCPECGSLDVGYSGFGTEMVEQEVGVLFPYATVARLDTDSAKDKDVMGKVLDDFRAGRIDILLGTQMVAKGLNFPGVELVGIVLADSGMNIPDFRAQERTFSLLVQVSGRAGRYNDRGRVVIQTFRPDNPAITYACSGDVASFYEQELQVRKETGFPPYSRLINLVLRGRNERKVSDTTRSLANLLEDLCSRMSEAMDGRSSGADASSQDAPQVFGWSECPLEKIAGNWRHHILMLGRDPARVHAVVGRALESFQVPSGIYIEVDVDPLQLL